MWKGNKEFIAYSRVGTRELSCRIALITSLILLITGCANVQRGGSGIDQPALTSYDANSWRTLVPSTCRRFFDGCNQCVRSSADAEAACTRKACAEYAKPVCLDSPISEGRMVPYDCAGQEYSITYDLYVSEGQTLQLTQGQVMFRDRQTHTVKLLTRQRSASGEDYVGDGVNFWVKGDEAMLTVGGKLEDAVPCLRVD